MADFEPACNFQNIDMRELSGLPSATFDFSWSSCSFEHLGSLQAGADLVRRSTRLIRPGGNAAHTTEFNVTSNEETIERGASVIYRRCDIEDLDRSLRELGCGIENLDVEVGFDTISNSMSHHITSRDDSTLS